MNRCGESDCRLPAHAPRGIPSNVTYRPLPRSEWDRRDVNEPGPIRRSDISWQAVVEAFVVFCAVALVVFLMSLQDVR